MKEKKIRKKWSKRKKLYAVNIAMLLFIVGTIMFRWSVLLIPPYYIFSYTLVQVAFTIFSLIVYYLSIIADAISCRKDAREKEGKTENGVEHK